jgi:hypothetical protein
MPEKQKTRSWKDPKTIIAATSITAIITLWNAFATHDRHRTETLHSIASTPSTGPQATINTVCPPSLQTTSPGTECVTHTRSS